jgi:broad specificity phosphatase PhoE
MRLFLIRHGAVIPPAPGAFYGGADVPLSDVGKAEAKAAARFLADIEVDHIVASPLERAHYGARQVAEHRDMPVELFDGLREIDRGRWFGLTREEIEQRWPGDIDAHFSDPFNWRENGGESLGDLRERVLKVRDELRDRHRGRTVVLVSHMFPTRSMLADARGLDFDQWLSLEIPTASVSLVDYNDNDKGRVAWVGHKPDGLPVTRVFPQHFR